MKTKNKIIFINFFNNYSGSPNILSIIIRKFIERKYNVELITSRTEGFLSDISDIKYNYVSYKWSSKKLVTLFSFIQVQVQLFFKVLFHKDKDAIFYINTVTPIGAAWACKLTRKKRIYHIHENMQQHKPLYSLYRWTYKHCNTKSIFVSNYLQKLNVGSKNSIVVHNSLNQKFQTVANAYLKHPNEEKTIILMVASLRRYKGIYEFVQLAKRLPQYQFEMILSCSKKEVEKFIKETNTPNNLIVHPIQINLHPYYQRAKLLLQLSHPKECKETFGLTILEAMVYGVPAIVPNIGGPLELIEDDINGFTINPLDEDLLVEKTRLLMEDKKLYDKFSVASIQKAKEFDLETMINKIENYITQ